MRDVLFLSYRYPPLGGGGVQRALKFTKFLPRNGWRPHVVTTGSRWYARTGTLDESMSRDMAPETTVTRVPELPAWGGYMALLWLAERIPALRNAQSSSRPA